MITVPSDTFAKALLSSYALAVRIDVFVSGQFTPMPRARWWESGVITADNSQTSRWQLSLNVSDNGIADLLPPLATELHVFYGVQYGNGEIESIQVGTFVVTELDPDLTNTDPQLTITCLDRWVYVSNNRFMTTQTVAADSSIAATIQQYVLGAMPAWLTGVVVVDTVTDRSTVQVARTIAVPGDRGGESQDMATSIGAEVFFDPTGQLILRDVPTAGTITGTIAQKQLISGTQTRDTDRTFNQYTIQQCYSDGSPSSLQWTFPDNDPTSPTSIAKIGVVNRLYQSSWITSANQARSAALSLLAASRGFESSFALDSIPDPRIEPGDTVLVVSPRLNVDGTFGAISEVSVIDAFTLDLTGQASAVTCRYWQASQALPDETTVFTT